MRRFAWISVIFVSTIFSFSAKAMQFTCEDRGFLIRELARLNQSCGADNANLCKARGYSGSTVESAIQSCIGLGYDELFCSQDVTCTDGAPLCKARGYAGSNVDKAIKICGKSGYGDAFCSQSVGCTGTATICKSRGYAGSSADSAIDHCSKYGGYDRAYCSQNVSCN